MNLYDAECIIASAVADQRPRKVFAFFSGGHDSLTATHAAMRTGLVDAVVHIATGTGIPDTFAFVQETCRAQGWPLLVYRPPLDTATGIPGMQYRDFVLREGFPGPGGHIFPYTLLKERAIEQLMRDHKRSRADRIMFVTGIRKQESRRRMGYAGNVRKQKARVWVNPIVDWTADDCGEYMQTNRIRRSMVVDTLHMSGECLCGAFARKGELDEIGLWYPRTAAWIRDLEAAAATKGVHCKWGTRPPSYYKLMRRGQMELPLCASCMKHEEDAEWMGDEGIA